MITVQYLPSLRTNIRITAATPITNVALNQSVCDYSGCQNNVEWRMHESCLTDGNRCTTGLDYCFCSAILSHASPKENEFVTVDLGSVNTIYVYVNAALLTLETNPGAGYVLMLFEREAYTPA